MRSTDVLTEGFERVRALVHSAVRDLSMEQLAHRPGPCANSVAWLIWHLTRIQDYHISRVSATEQEWLANGWSHRFGLPFGPDETGFGQTPEEARSEEHTSE